MNSRERINLKLQGKKIDRTIFCPAVYEHKAKLIGKSPSLVSQSAELLEQAVLAEYEIYKPDMLTVGIDVYNLEPEALGSEVVFPDSNEGVPVIRDRILKDINGIDKLPDIDPESDGRMPLLLEASERINKKLGGDVYVRGSISGPYSICAELLGIEEMIMSLMMQPQEAVNLLELCTNAAIKFGKAYLNRGVEVCVFDSQASPPLVSPQLYKDIVLPNVQRLMRELKRAGAKFIEYVAGGDTGPIADSLFVSGAEIILSDFSSDAEVFIKKSKNSNAVIRRNISPIVIENGTEQELVEIIKETVKLAKSNDNVIIGTGVLSYNMDIKRVLRLKELIFEDSED